MPESYFAVGQRKCSRSCLSCHIHITADTLLTSGPACSRKLEYTSRNPPHISHKPTMDFVGITGYGTCNQAPGCFCRPPGVGEEMDLSRQNSEAVRTADMWQRSSMSAAQGQAPDPKRKGRFQIVEDDIVDNKLRPSRNVSSASLSEKVQQVCADPDSMCTPCLSCHPL